MTKLHVHEFNQSKAHDGRRYLVRYDRVYPSTFVLFGIEATRFSSLSHQLFELLFT